MNIIFSLSAHCHGLLLQQGYATLYDNILLQDLILHALVYIVQFAWSVFCFLIVGVCSFVYWQYQLQHCMISSRANTPTSLNVAKHKQSLLKRPPAQSLSPNFFLWENAVELFSCHARFISEASDCCWSDKPEQPHQELSHGTRGAEARRMKLS